jgi:hypothetical protein
VIELLRGYFGIERGDEPRKIQEKVTGKVLTLATALGPAVPAWSLDATSNLPHRSINCSITPPPGRRVAAAQRSFLQPRLCSACSNATMRGAESSHVRLITDSLVPRQRDIA